MTAGREVGDEATIDADRGKLGQLLDIAARVMVGGERIDEVPTGANHGEIEALLRGRAADAAALEKCCEGRVGREDAVPGRRGAATDAGAVDTASLADQREADLALDSLTERGDVEPGQIGGRVARRIHAVMPPVVMQQAELDPTSSVGGQAEVQGRDGRRDAGTRNGDRGQDHGGAESQHSGHRMSPSALQARLWRSPGLGVRNSPASELVVCGRPRSAAVHSRRRGRPGRRGRPRTASVLQGAQGDEVLEVPVVTCRTHLPNIGTGQSGRLAPTRSSRSASPNPAALIWRM